MKVCLQMLYRLLSVRVTCPAHLSHINSTEPIVCVQRTKHTWHAASQHEGPGSIPGQCT